MDHRESLPKHVVDLILLDLEFISSGTPTQLGITLLGIIILVESFILIVAILCN